MESYAVGDVPNNRMQKDYLHFDHTGRSQNDRAGTYGVSIRVQGIDGHPYVVLNNRNGQSAPNDSSSENGYSDSSKDRSFLDNYDEHDFKGRNNDEIPRPENPFVEYRSQKQMQLSGSHNGVPEFKELSRKSSALLNFQRHPELLEPYDPKKNALNLGGHHALPATTSAVTETENKENKHWSSLSKSSSPLNVQVRSRTPDKSKPEKNGVLNSTPPPYQEKPASRPLSIANEPVKLPSGSLSSVGSTNSSLEHRRPRPDIVPLRRQDSSGPVLETSRSRRSSASSTSIGSLQNKLCLEDQEDALYAENVNRHGNRRYIPFLPGTGRDIDTGSIPAVDDLIDRFDGKESPQRRGRSGRRNRINAEDRKRSRSVDSALPFGLRGNSDYLDDFSRNQGRSTEHLLKPSQLRKQKSSPEDSSIPSKERQSGNPANSSGSLGGFNDKKHEEWHSSPSSLNGQDRIRLNGSSTYGGNKTYLSRSSTLLMPYNGKGTEEKTERSGKMLTSTATTLLSKSSWSSVKKPSSERDIQATPDLLKGQQALSQQTNEETAKQILFNYLKDGSTDNDDTTKKKVNLVFEKIQTLKSRAAGSVQADNKSPDSSAEVKALQEKQTELEKQVTELKRELEQETKNQQSLTESNAVTKENMKDLQKNLEESLQESNRLREQLAKAEKEHRATIEELYQVKMEREQYQNEIRDLQDQLSEMHDELDSAKQAGAEDEEKDALTEDLLQLKQDFQEIMLFKEEQEDMLRRRERELTALKGALKEEVATHDQEVDKLKEQYDKELQKLRTSLAEATQNNVSLSSEKVASDEVKNAVQNQVKKLMDENERLRRKILALEAEAAELNKIIDKTKREESCAKEKMGRLEKEKKQLEEALGEVKDQEEEMSMANRVLESRLEDVQRSLGKMTREHQELSERLKEEKSQKEQFKRTKNEVEDERRHLDRTIEKLQKEMNEIVETSQRSTLDLQVQIDEYKEKNRKEMTDLQRQLRDKSAELEKSRLATKKLQDEMSILAEDLKQCKTERDEAVFRGQHLEQKVYDLEVEMENKSHVKDDRSRQIKLMEGRISQLETDLDEERNSGDLLMDRVDRGREQLEQMRNELLQERAARQDLECDKTSLERQNKDLRSRVAHLEGFQRSNKDGVVSQLESRVHELEDRLEGEERERANLQLANRRLERKVKELMMQVDDEHTSLMDQKDQLQLRLKTMKRQMDEAEEEIERLEHGKKKLQRDLDEQIELHDQLQGQLNTLRNDMRRKNTSANVLDDLDDDEDDLSVDGECFHVVSSGYVAL
ncbi:cingulin-like protein 1 [Acipenser oxyrinchus oxyrinchus]|uniref:Cingulin-like protein 1 n=1 Tax=Acipenser oxyrinchus oxyrinchus TaxID=40147 RepID=A0AAD8FYD9_ACIOX|nr:cingulin-like protein 1 [Acipenser oxyrinchus oxyrinchus]